tara:strand:- start:2205 stop:3077 length:873 start_codon:yes stop_codon:yes gene_type:complete
MPNARLDNCQIEYDDTGSGVPLIFSHEFAGNMESWTMQKNYFARRYRVISYNAKGYPPSSIPETWQEYTYDHQVKVLLDLLNHLHLEKAYICGLSMGAYTALQFGIAHPERCIGIISAGVGTGSADPKKFLSESEERANLLDTKGMLAMESYLSGSTRIRFKEKDPLGWQVFSDLFHQHSPQGSANTLRGFQGRRPSIFTLTKQLQELNVPILVMYGDEDEPCVEPSLFIKKNAPRCGLAVLPQTGHACNLEEPAMFNYFVGEFIASVEAEKWNEMPEDSGDNWAVSRTS